MINGRISPRSYPRYRLIRPFFRRVLGDVDRFCVQSEESARRLLDLGADPAHVTVTGSLKFDSLELPSPAAHGKPRERVLRFFRLSPHRTVLVAGSTMRGEEAAVLGAFAQDQGDGAERAAGARAEAPGAVRRSRAASRARPGFVTITTLRAANRRRAARRCRRPRHHRRAGAAVSGRTAVFVGGSLEDHGGHNILEPAIFGKPIVFGPHMQNFKEIAEAFLANAAAIQVQTERELEDGSAWPGDRSSAPRPARRRGACPRRSQSWRKDEDARRDRRTAAAQRRRPWSGPIGCSSLPSGALIADTQRGVRRGGGVAARVVCARSIAASSAGATGRQRRQPAHRRQRQDTDRRIHRAAAARAR